MPITKRERKSKFIHLNDTVKKPGIVCGPFHALSYYIGCPFACSYCYLQGTFRGKIDPVVYTNREKLLAELDEWLKLPGSLRLNAGELEDSLALDGYIPMVDDLVPRFAAQKRHKLILVTKATKIKNLLKHDPKGQTVVSFSISCKTAWKKFEKGTPHPSKRIEAAKQVKEAGYYVTLRLDPMLPIDNWQQEYAETIQLVYKTFKPDQWTIGSIRFFPSLPMWTAKVGRSTNVYNFNCERCKEDGRYRLPLEVRAELYTFAGKQIRKHDKKVPIRFCKETTSLYRILRLKPNGCCYTQAMQNGHLV